MKQALCLLAACLLCTPAQAATSLRGMETGEDFRIGPVFTTGLPLGIPEPGDRQYYMLSLQGESPNHGFSRFFLRVISLYELLDLKNLSTPATTEKTVRFHHQFATVGLESPLFYEVFSPLNLEFGWSAGFTLARVTFKEPIKPAATGITSVFSDYPEIQATALGAQQKTNPAQADTQFLGGELGFYGRYYQFYPFVPYAGLRANLGSYFNVASLVSGTVPKASPAQPGTTVTTPASTTRTRVYEGGFKFSPVATVGLDFYLGSRGLLGAELSFWNWDILGRPQDNTIFVSLKAGFLF